MGIRLFDLRHYKTLLEFEGHESGEEVFASYEPPGKPREAVHGTLEKVFRNRDTATHPSDVWFRIKGDDGIDADYFGPHLVFPNLDGSLRITLLSGTSRVIFPDPDTNYRFDIYSPRDYCVGAYGPNNLSLGITMDVPEGYEVQLRPAVRVIQNGLMYPYPNFAVWHGDRGELSVILVNTLTEARWVRQGDHLATAVVVPLEALPVDVKIIEDQI
jgi:dUTPase